MGSPAYYHVCGPRFLGAIFGGSRGKTPWPKERPAQVEEAVSAALNAVGREVTAAGFARGKKEAVAEILAALVIIGRAHKGGKRGAYTA